MIIIAFARNTSKLLPRVLCRNFRHCAPIVPTPDGAAPFVMHQFVRRGKIVEIPIHMRDIKLLSHNGWRFVYVPRDIAPGFNPRAAYSCVDLSKRAIGLCEWRILRPDALYRRIAHQ